MWRVDLRFICLLVFSLSLPLISGCGDDVDMYELAKRRAAFEEEEAKSEAAKNAGEASGANPGQVAADAQPKPEGNPNAQPPNANHLSRSQPLPLRTRQVTRLNLRIPPEQLRLGIRSPRRLPWLNGSVLRSNRLSCMMALKLDL